MAVPWSGWAGARLGAVLVLELARGNLFERNREVVPVAGDIDHRRRVLAEAALAEAVVVAVDLTGPLGGDDYGRVVGVSVVKELVNAWFDHSAAESSGIPNSARTIPSSSSAARSRSSLMTVCANSP